MVLDNNTLRPKTGFAVSVGEDEEMVRGVTGKIFCGLICMLRLERRSGSNNNIGKISFCLFSLYEHGKPPAATNFRMK